MKLFFTYLFSFIFLFNQISHSYTVGKKTNIYQYLNNCNDINEFDKYYRCFYKNLKNKNLDIVFNSPLKRTKLKGRDRDLSTLLIIAQLINVAIDNDFMSDKEGTEEWLKILKSDYSKKIKKQKLDEVINESKCLDKSEFKSFSDCFYKDFRNLNVYKKSDLLTKKRIENLMLNTMHLAEDFESNLVILKDKEGKIVDSFMGEDDGFTFFLMTMNGLGTDFYKKKDSDINYKKILIFIAVVVIIALVAKGALGKSAGKTNVTSGSSTTSSATAKCATGRGVLCRGAGQGIQKTQWFRYAYSRGLF